MIGHRSRATVAISRVFRTLRVTVGALAASIIAMAVPAFSQHLPGTPTDLAFDAFAATIDLENPQLVFSYKNGSKGGSSIGFHISEAGGRKFGTFAPENSSSIPEAEVVSYRLSRFLGISDTYNPVTYHTLGPLASSRFKVLLSQHREIYDGRRDNYANIVKKLKAQPGSIVGIFRNRPKGDIYRASSLGVEGRFNHSHPLAVAMQARNPLPSDKLMSLPGVKGQRADYPAPTAPERDLARELSSIMVVDQLMGQWDRFWKNLEAFGDKRGRLHLLARDNGGATLNDWVQHSDYDRWVSRYDRSVIEKLEALHAFLSGQSSQFAGYTTVEAWKTDVGFLRVDSFATFKKKLALLVTKRAPALEKQYGARVYFETTTPPPAASTTPPPQ